MSPIITTMSAPAGRGRRVRAPGASTTVQPFFEDTFAGTQKNPANGFTYEPPAGDVSVVSFDGYNCLRFRYPAKASPEDTNVEQRFDMGRQLSELWLDYHIYIPSNLALRQFGGSDTPNKFLSLWPLTYSTTGETYVVTEFWRDGADTTSYARMLGLGDIFYNSGGTSFIRDGDAVQSSNFITAARGGAWSRIRVHYKIASGAGQTNGVYEGWLGTTLMWRSRSDWQFWSTGGLNYIQRGYLMGSSNAGYAAQTDYYIRNLKFYDQNPQWSDL